MNTFQDHNGQYMLVDNSGNAVAVTPRAWNVSTLSYIALNIDNSGNLLTAGSGAGAGGAATVADGADVAQGTTTDAAVITDATGTLSGKIRGLVKWAFERMPASLGQKTMSLALPVSIASDQSAISVTGPLTDTQIRTTPLPVNGTVTANQGGSPWSENISQFGGSAVATGTGASGSGVPRVTVANDSNILATQSGTWNVGTLTSITNPVSITGTLTGITNSVAVTGTFFQTTQPISGTVTSNITQINSATASVTNPLPVQVSNGAQFTDQDATTRLLASLQAKQLIASLAYPMSGFLPIEVPLFLTGV